MGAVIKDYIHITQNILYTLDDM